MRSFTLDYIIFVVLIRSAFAIPHNAQHKLNTAEDVLSEASGGLVDSGTNNVASSASSTVFNGIDVPPMKELNGTEFDKEIKDGYWFVMSLRLYLIFFSV